MRTFNCALVVEDDGPLRRSVVHVLKTFSRTVIEAETQVGALTALGESPDLVLLDVRLPDGSGVHLAAQAARQRPMPVIVAMSGRASTNETYELGMLGVRGYVAKPFTLDVLMEKLEAAERHPPRFEPFVSAWVGVTDLPAMISKVRRLMVDEALAQSDGSRRGAALRLGVSRQAVQQLVRKDEHLARRVRSPKSPTPT